MRGFASDMLGVESPRPEDRAAHFRDAEADYRDASDRDAKGRFRFALLANRGALRFHRGRLDEALVDLKAAIALNPRGMSAYVNMARTRWQQDQFDEAIELLGRAISLEPGMARLYRLRAHWTLKRPSSTPTARERAHADLTSAIAHDAPGSRELAEDLAAQARLLLLDRQDLQALEDCDAAMCITPENTEVQRCRVLALLELDRFGDAIAGCDACLRAGQTSPELPEPARTGQGEEE